MSPPSATVTETFPILGDKATQNSDPPSKDSEKMAAMAGFPGIPTFTDAFQERDYQKGRLALAFRIFAKLGFDEGVAGHITLRVYSILLHSSTH